MPKTCIFGTKHRNTDSKKCLKCRHTFFLSNGDGIGTLFFMSTWLFLTLFWQAQQIHIENCSYFIFVGVGIGIGTDRRCRYRYRQTLSVFFIWRAGTLWLQQCTFQKFPGIWFCLPGRPSLSCSGLIRRKRRQDVVDWLDRFESRPKTGQVRRKCPENNGSKVDLKMVF